MRAATVRPHAVAGVVAESGVRGRDDRQLDADAHVQRECMPGRRRTHHVVVHALDANDSAAGRMHAGLRAGFNGVPDGRPQRLLGQRAVYEHVRNVLHRGEGVPGGLQRQQHELPHRLHRSDAFDVRDLVAVECVHAGQRLRGRAAGVLVADGASDHADVPCTVREHAADGAVGPWRDVSGMDLAADRAVPVAAVVLVADTAQHRACVPRWERPAGRYVGAWHHLPGLGVQRRDLPAAGTNAVPLLQWRTARLLHEHGGSAADGRSAGPRRCGRQRQRRHELLPRDAQPQRLVDRMVRGGRWHRRSRLLGQRQRQQQQLRHHWQLFLWLQGHRHGSAHPLEHNASLSLHVRVRSSALGRLSAYTSRTSFDSWVQITPIRLRV